MTAGREHRMDKDVKDVMNGAVALVKILVGVLFWSVVIAWVLHALAGE